MRPILIVLAVLLAGSPVVLAQWHEDAWSVSSFATNRLPVFRSYPEIGVEGYMTLEQTMMADLWHAYAERYYAVQTSDTVSPTQLWQTVKDDYYGKPVHGVDFQTLLFSRGLHDFFPILRHGISLLGGYYLNDGVEDIYGGWDAFHSAVAGDVDWWFPSGVCGCQNGRLIWPTYANAVYYSNAWPRINIHVNLATNWASFFVSRGVTPWGPALTNYPDIEAGRTSKDYGFAAYRSVLSALNKSVVPTTISYDYKGFIKQPWEGSGVTNTVGVGVAEWAAQAIDLIEYETNRVVNDSELWITCEASFNNSYSRSRQPYGTNWYEWGSDAFVAIDIDVVTNVVANVSYVSPHLRRGYHASVYAVTEHLGGTVTNTYEFIEYDGCTVPDEYGRTFPVVSQVVTTQIIRALGGFTETTAFASSCQCKARYSVMATGVVSATNDVIALRLPEDIESYDITNNIQVAEGSYFYDCVVSGHEGYEGVALSPIIRFRARGFTMLRVHDFLYQ